MERLEKDTPLARKSHLLKLTPFLDEKGLLRVKGRLMNSSLPPETRHPLILPATGRLTELLIQEAHHNTLHGGARLTLSHLRQKYWIIGGNRTVKKQLRQCVRCHRFKPHRNQQLMADLPMERVTPSRPFTNTGVDFTGHVDIKINKGRGVKTCKAYIAIFICMGTKAVHLELVSDLSTQTFLAAFKRMCARRGTPKHMFSDNGGNFIGAAKLLQADFERNKTFRTSEFNDEMSHLQVQWHFNAPLWPTAGGLWEAAVKSMKYHLKRVLGEQKLTFEQFTTLLTQIEACLNSRPLCPLSEDTDDLEYLTPGHFLIGGPLVSLPQEEEDFCQHDLRNRWRLVEQMSLHFWKRWSVEYLHQLQTRSKWQQSERDLEKGNLVLVKDENLPPGKWALGRIMETHPGTDNKVRVVTIKTRRGLLKRPITKLVPLPLPENKQTINNDNNQQESKTTQRKPSCRKKQFSLFSILLMFLIVTFTPVNSQQVASYKVTPINNDHPVYFDEAGKLQLVHDEWILLVYYNLTSYWQATTKINNYIGEIDEICQRMNHTPCEAIVDHLRHELQHLKEYNTMLLSQHQHLSRQKRGYFDGIGKLASTLFGVLDVDFATKYEEDIKSLKQNDNYLLQLIKNQTLIIEVENNIIKRNEKFMDKQCQMLNAYMNQTWKEITQLQNRVQKLYAMNDVNSAAITSTLILKDLQKIQEMLLNALSDIYKGHLDAQLFSASQLIDQLNIISGKLPMGLTLPVKDVQQDIQNIYELIYVKARITSNYLLFELHIPLLSDEDYTIYRVIPIPFMKQGQLKIIRPSANYIAINFVKNSYITMEQSDIQMCIKYDEDRYTCMTRQPVYRLQEENAPCEAQVFGQQVSLSCVIEDAQCRETWTKLHKSNLWLFTLCRKHMMRVICNDQVTPAAIDGNGIITLQTKCVLQMENGIIFTYNHLGNRIYMETDMDVPTINSTINNIFQVNWNNARLNITELKTSTTNDYADIEKKLAYQKEHENLPLSSDVSIHDVYHYIITSLLVVGIFLLGMYIYIKRRCSKKPETTTDGKPRLERVEIEVQEMHRPTPSEPVYSEVKTKRRGFNFDDISP